MSPDEAGEFVQSQIEVTGEDIARAKNWILVNPASKVDQSSKVDQLADQWLQEQGLVGIRPIDIDATDCRAPLASAAKAYSVRLAFYQAVWELIAAAHIIPTEIASHWMPTLQYHTEHGAGGIPISTACYYPGRIGRLPYPRREPTDPDIFLQGIDCTTLHSGIVEAIEQAINCFRRGLYLPSIAMLTAAAEATWTECGSAIAGSLKDNRLSETMQDPHSGIAKVVGSVRRTLEHKCARSLLKQAAVSMHHVTDAEVWTSALRERRNALHWDKANSFILDHSEAGTLLMAAPQHVRTLEAIRAAC